MSKNILKLNTDKTEVIIFGKKYERLKTATLLGKKGFEVAETVKNLGVIIDSDLSFNSHMKAVSKSAFYHLENIAKVKNFMSSVDLEKFIHAFITSRVDYCNGLFTGLPTKTIKPLQIIQNAAARLLTRTKRKDHITPILKSLHWLPVTYRIDFKVILLAFKSLNGQGSLYIAEMFEKYSPSRSLRLAGKFQMVQPSTRTKQGEAAFSCYAFRLWNRLPIDIKTSPTIPFFKSRLKTKLFHDAFH